MLTFPAKINKGETLRARQIEVMLWRSTKKLLKRRYIGATSNDIIKAASAITNTLYIDAFGMNAQSIVEICFDSSLRTNGIIVTAKRIATKDDARLNCVLTVAKNYLDSTNLHKLAYERKMFNKMLSNQTTVDKDWITEHTYAGDENITGAVLVAINKAATATAIDQVKKAMVGLTHKNVSRILSEHAAA